jgi:uncharacterized phage protein gp47/JayE
VAPPDVVADVQSVLDEQDYANMTIVVSSFTALPTAVTVATTLQTGFTLAAVTSSVQTAISNYITALGAGETLRVAGIVDSVFGLAGIADVVVTVPAANQTTPAASKRTPGVITVS